MKPVCWVTTFSKDLYEVSGKKLIESFTSFDTCGDLIVFAEGLSVPSYLTDRVRFISLSQDVSPIARAFNDIVKRFCKMHAASIPVEYGGANTRGCECSGGPYEPHSKRHRLPCVGHWFCRNAARWFRKVLAMSLVCDENDDASQIDPYGRAVWVDSDCVFKAPVTETVLKQWFKVTGGDQAQCLYMQASRPVTETGIVAFDLEDFGRELVRRWYNMYWRHDYLLAPRWDDSFMFDQMRKENAKQGRFLDVATMVGEHAAVVPGSRFGKWIEHDKGRHSRKTGIMK